ncbi:MAG TPA: tetratricopeptide repeat-containing sensor histidine kinase [Bacteroidales bacterium]|nr:tetratricopeptide repeat-containing sensor histidine kinase [Bacteroidales bacterium]
MYFRKQSLIILLLSYLLIPVCLSHASTWASSSFDSSFDSAQDDENNAQYDGRDEHYYLQKDIGFADNDTDRVDLLLQVSEEILKSQPGEAYLASSDALKISKKIKDTKRIGLSFRSLADFYLITAQYDKALEYLYLALDEFQQSKDSLAIAVCFNEIGLVHMSAGDFSEAHSNFAHALDINKTIASHSQIAVNYLNMGMNYLNADSMDKGLSYFLVSLMIADSLNMETEKLLLMKNIGFAYARMGRHEDALEHFYKVLELLGKAPDDLTRSEAQLNIAKGYYQVKNYPAALKYAQLCFDLSGDRHFDQIYRDAAGLLSDIHASRGEYQQAYRFVKIHREMSDTVMNSERAAQLARIRILYDVSQKEKENLTLREQITRNIERVRLGTLLVIMITTLVFVLAILLFLLFRMNNRYINLNRKLAAQSHELEELNDLKDKFFSFVALNLKNPFNTIMGFSELMNRAAEAKDIVKARDYSGLIYDLSAQVQKVLSNLQEWSRLQRRTFEVKQETVELTSLIKDVAEMNNKEAVRKDINLIIKAEGNIFVTADRTMIAAVLQNLVTNAIQFTPSSGKIIIDSKVDNNSAEVTVTDNGIGMTKESLDMLFDFDFSQSRSVTSDHGGAGLGLVICHDMLLKNGGTIHAESEPGKGSKFTFTLPVINRNEQAGPVNHEPQTTPDDVTDNLLKSDDPVDEELINALKTNVVPQFEEVSKVLSIDELENFSSTLINTGEKYHNVQLTGYGKSLKTLTHRHQIDQIIRILPRFREYLKKVHVL